jgi:hypothetical protein
VTLRIAPCGFCGGETFGQDEHECSSPGSPQPGENAPLETVDLAGRGLIYAMGDRVVFEVPNFGRIELPPDVAERVARGMLEAAAIVRRSPALRSVKVPT